MRKTLRSKDSAFCFSSCGMISRDCKIFITKMTITGKALGEHRATAKAIYSH